MPITFRHQSALVTITKIPNSQNGVVEIRNSGTFTQTAFQALRPKVIEATRQAPAIVVRMDTAADIVVDPPSTDEPMYLEDLPDQAVVCSDWQFPIWLRHTMSLRRLGVRRSVFTVDQLPIALQWAELAAGIRLRRLAHGRGDLAASGPAPLA